MKPIKIWKYVCVMLLLGVSGHAIGQSEQEYRICMEHCTPEHSFDGCSLTSRCGRYKDYNVCLRHCVEDYSFDSCSLESRCGEGRQDYEICMKYCVPEYGFDSCSLESRCGS